MAEYSWFSITMSAIGFTVGGGVVVGGGVGLDDGQGCPRLQCPGFGAASAAPNTTNDVNTPITAVRITRTSAFRANPPRMDMAVPPRYRPAWGRRGGRAEPIT